MHASIIALLLSTPLMLALPLDSRATPQTANIALKTGDGDSSVGLTIAVNTLVPSTQQTNRGVNAQASTQNVFCQAFSDVKGTKKLGGVFTSTTSASFTSASQGDTGSSADQAVDIGAFCCVTTANGFGACKPKASSGTPPTKPSNNPPSKTAPASSSSTTASVRLGLPPTTTVRVQFDGGDDDAAQAEIAADDSVVLIKNSAPLFEDVLDAFIVSANGVANPTCQAYSDETGSVQSKVGPRFGLNDVALAVGGKTAKVLSLRCRSN